MNLRTIIVEDEPLARLFLENLLKEFCPNTEIVAQAKTEDEAVSLIEAYKPDLLFLDIELQQGSGFGVMQRINTRPRIIFTTAYDHYAINAIRLSGIEYLLKPFDSDSLQTAISSACEKTSEHAAQAIEHMMETLANNNTAVHLALQN